ncbi:pyridoxamine 5'-phosphate oxidase family protein [Pendulispora rubella]|uniref:Pyridoxamine 5'-phosphate oxidase family protein n=1 Tax=Pendulispora rubella TaxID=2741070 RepID=A0ABZ2KUX8_9BACT
MSASPFHAGERAIQERAGVREKIEAIGGKVIRDYMPDQHREFFVQLPFMLLSARDASMHPRASLLVGRPGFVHSPDPRTLRIDALPGAFSPVTLSVGDPIGLLGIQLETRRRNRMNGTITAIDGRGFTVHVDQSFGNCPQYIQSRAHGFVREPSEPSASTTRPEGARLSAEASAMVERADTFFIASGAADVREGLDVSHRGGKPGFVRREEHEGHTVLTWPEFRGNFYFNTLGNIAQNARTGLLFVDFDTGNCLSLAGEAEILWDTPELAAFAGAQRFVRFRVTSGLFLPDALPLRWSAPEQARELPATGSWPG